MLSDPKLFTALTEVELANVICSTDGLTKSILDIYIFNDSYSSHKKRLPLKNLLLRQLDRDDIDRCV